MPAAIRIGRFLVLNKEFDADDDEITRTRKIRRRFVAEKYAAMVEAFYSGAAEVEVSHRDHLRGRAQGDAALATIGDVDGRRSRTPRRTASALAGTADACLARCEAACGGVSNA